MDEVTVHCEALIDCYERAEEADEELQYWMPELEAVLNAGIMADLKSVIEKLDFIQKIVVKAVGGSDKLVKLQHDVHAAQDADEGGDRQTPGENETLLKAHPPEVLSSLYRATKALKAAMMRSHLGETVSYEEMAQAVLDAVKDC